MLHAVEPRDASHRLRINELPVPEDTDTPDNFQPTPELSDDDWEPPDKEEEAAPTDLGSSNSSKDDPMVVWLLNLRMPSGYSVLCKQLTASTLL